MQAINISTSASVFPCVQVQARSQFTFCFLTALTLFTWTVKRQKTEAMAPGKGRRKIEVDMRLAASNGVRQTAVKTQWFNNECSQPSRDAPRTSEHQYIGASGPQNIGAAGKGKPASYTNICKSKNKKMKAKHWQTTWRTERMMLPVSQCTQKNKTSIWEFNGPEKSEGFWNLL